MHTWDVFSKGCKINLNNDFSSIRYLSIPFIYKGNWTFETVRILATAM